MVKTKEEERVFSEVMLADLLLIRQFVRETALAYTLDTARPDETITAVDELIVAVNEALANIVRHAYQRGPGKIKVTVRCGGGAVAVILLDGGPGFDPTLVPSPDTTLPLAERPFGGMGVHMMRSFCDEVRYRRTGRGENELTLVKQVS